MIMSRTVTSCELVHCIAPDFGVATRSLVCPATPRIFIFETPSSVRQYSPHSSRYVFDSSTTSESPAFFAFVMRLCSAGRSFGFCGVSTIVESHLVESHVYSLRRLTMKSTVSPDDTFSVTEGLLPTPSPFSSVALQSVVPFLAILATIPSPHVPSVSATVPVIFKVPETGAVQRMTASLAFPGCKEPFAPSMGKFASPPCQALLAESQVNCV